MTEQLFTVEGAERQPLKTFTEKAYLDYSMYVILDRALPHIGDGLKPVQRRIIYAMSELSLDYQAKPKKSARTVGDVLGKYHPHGDTACYEAMVLMAQPFSYRYPIIDGQGNWGSMDDPKSFAAMRYTEAKLSKYAEVLLSELAQGTVDWQPNFDGTLEEPVLLPARLPNLLLNGTLGIAVGMATNIPPHNLREVVAAAVHLIENPDATTDDLLQFVKGPDFPLGGVAFNHTDIKHAYGSGKGPVVVRGEAEIVDDGKKDARIIITSIPYRVNKSELISRIADLVQEKKLEGIRDLRDESASDIRVVVELKGTAHPQAVLNELYKHTELESTFHYNMLALVDGVPEMLSLSAMLGHFLKHRQEVVRLRTEFDLRQAQAREHILLGLCKALDHIDEVIAIIRKAVDIPSASLALQKKFAFSPLQ